MDRPTIRRAARYDTGAMARLLNQFIATRGITAMSAPVSGTEIARFIAAPGAAWHLAEIDGKIAGVQWVEPHDALPSGACEIATFVQQGRAGLGVGSELFAATQAVARQLGYAWINANIRADNEAGLTYYQSRGFRDWKRVQRVEVAPGLIVDKIWKRYDLD